MDIIVEIIAGLIIVIPLVIALVKYVVCSVKQKNWTALVQLALKFIAEAETLYTTGAEKKAYVVKMLIVAAKEINFEISEEEIDKLIENIIAVTNEVNVSK